MIFHLKQTKFPNSPINPILYLSRMSLFYLKTYIYFFLIFNKKNFIINTQLFFYNYLKEDIKIIYLMKI
jgi:hypothetical protein